MEKFAYKFKFVQKFIFIKMKDSTKPLDANRCAEEGMTD